MVRLRLALPSYDKEALIRFRVDKSFKTRSRITKRTLEVAKAFGIGVDEEKVFRVYKEFELEVNPGEIIYITGESGSGKSILLREIGRRLVRRREFGGVLMDHELKIDPNEILIHGVGRDTREAIELLSMVGLNEAYLFLRKYRELSEGQKYRYRLAKAFWSGKKTIIFDEFCSTLDRITARVVAYLCQKFCRRRKLTLIAASAHEDLIEDLNPNKVIVKRFGPYAELRILDPKPRPCSILKHLKIEDGTHQDYKMLAAFHYIGGRVGYVRRIFRAVVELDDLRELAGVVV
ncbi:MAG TPA: ATP-binding cassette domain-containing protein, partial [Nitrososphaeria archaeon]|nr:ATP-binding cassette domain-containing protein [Nitrososphaeria archaeon]